LVLSRGEVKAKGAAGGFMSRTKYVVALVLALVMTFGAVGVASAAVRSDSSHLRKAVTPGGILQPERAFHAIANRNDGTRASRTAGYTASANYVARKLKNAGYSVRRQEFESDVFV
jgi:hypothetical protein